MEADPPSSVSEEGELCSCPLASEEKEAKDKDKDEMPNAASFYTEGGKRLNWKYFIGAWEDDEVTEGTAAVRHICPVGMCHGTRGPTKSPGLMSGLQPEVVKETKDAANKDPFVDLKHAEVEEIANGALYLLSDKASYSTGAILDANGGWVSP